MLNNLKTGVRKIDSDQIKEYSSNTTYETYYLYIVFERITQRQ